MFKMVRHAKLSEIQKIMAITNACGKKMISEGIFQWDEEYPNVKAFKNDLERNELYVYEEENEVLGCIVISTFMDKEYLDVNWLTETSEHFYIHRLAVKPSEQGKGIARKMMDFAENLAKGENKTSIRLDTFSQNSRNQKFYEARGYKRLDSIYFPRQSDFPFYCYELPVSDFK